MPVQADISSVNYFIQGLGIFFIMRTRGVRFSISSHAAWAPALHTSEAWAEWAGGGRDVADVGAFAGAGGEPAVPGMAPMLRRRAGLFGRMALQVAYQALGGGADVPTVFCSRHGDVGRAVALLADLSRGDPLSPTAFGTAVHNASAGLFSIARADRGNHMALAAGDGTVEHAVIEACGLLADGAPAVLLVASDLPLPSPFEPFEDGAGRAWAWAWLMVPPGADAIALAWQACAPQPADAAAAPAGLRILHFYLSGQRRFERAGDTRRWTWSRDAD
jgi:hypothetical protein